MIIEKTKKDQQYNNMHFVSLENTEENSSKDKHLYILPKNNKKKAFSRNVGWGRDVLWSSRPQPKNKSKKDKK